MAISIRDPYTSPFTSRCKFARCLLLVRCLCSETVAIGFLISVEPNFVERTALGSLKRRRSYSEVSKRRHNFGTKRFKEKSLFIFHARIALKSLILLFVRLIARGARIGKPHTHTDRQDKYCNPLAHARRGLTIRRYFRKTMLTPLPTTIYSIFREYHHCTFNHISS